MQELRGKMPILEQVAISNVTCCHSSLQKDKHIMPFDFNAGERREDGSFMLPAVADYHKLEACTGKHYWPA